jgi:hypothetical protein
MIADHVAGAVTPRRKFPSEKERDAFLVERRTGIALRARCPCQRAARVGVWVGPEADPDAGSVAGDDRGLSADLEAGSSADSVQHQPAAFVRVW